MDALMPWRVVFCPEKGVIETVYSGDLDPVELREAVDATLLLSQEHSASRFLGDCSGLLGGHSVFDLYGLVEFLQSVGFPDGFKEALLVPPEQAANAPDFEFWETACLNRGFEVRMFTDRADAMDWLAG
jgi:hypothetical protein